jgi:epsilon-lactone hydrolase
VIADDSAGGHLAASLLADIGLGQTLPQPGAAVLLSPMIDFSCPSVVRLDSVGRDPFMSPLTPNAECAYAGDADLADPRIAVLDADKSSWPAVLIQVGSTQCLRADSELMARSFGSNSRCTLEMWAGQVHVFQAFPLIPEARAALRRAGGWIRAEVQFAPGARP